MPAKKSPSRPVRPTVIAVQSKVKLNQKLSIVLGVLLVVGAIGALLAVGAPFGAPTIHLTQCGKLSQANTRYVLDNDVTAKGTCFALDAANITLDLNGHTVTYATEPSLTNGVYPQYNNYHYGVTAQASWDSAADKSGYVAAQDYYPFAAQHDTSNAEIKNGKIVEGGGDDQKIGSAAIDTTAPGGIFHLWLDSSKYADATATPDNTTSNVFMRVTDAAGVTTDSAKISVQFDQSLTAGEHTWPYQKLGPGSAGKVSVQTPQPNDVWNGAVPFTVIVDPSIVGVKKIEAYQEVSAGVTKLLGSTATASYSMTWDADASSIANGPARLSARLSFDGVTQKVLNNLFSGAMGSSSVAVNLQKGSAFQNTTQTPLGLDNDMFISSPRNGAIVGGHQMKLTVSVSHPPDPISAVQSVDFYLGHGACDLDASSVLRADFMQYYTTRRSVCDAVRLGQGGGHNAYVHHLDITTHGDTTTGINATYIVPTSIDHNVIHNNVQSLISRHQIQAMAISVDPGGSNEAVNPSHVSYTVNDNTIYGGPQGAIFASLSDGNIYNNQVNNLNIRYTNGFCYYGHGDRINIHDNTCQTDNGGGVHVDNPNGVVTGVKVQSNTIDVTATPYNEEYRWNKEYYDGQRCLLGQPCACIPGGSYGIQVEGASGSLVTNNTVTGTANLCPTEAFRATNSKQSSRGNTISNNTFTAKRGPGAAAGDFYAAAYAASFNGLGLNTAGDFDANQLDTFTGNTLIADSSPLHVDWDGLQGQVFKNNAFFKGTNLASNWSLATFRNGGNPDGTFAISTHNGLLDSTFGPGVDRTSVYSLVKYEWHNFSELGVGWSLPITALNGATPVSGATIAVTDRLNRDATGFDNANLPTIPVTDAAGKSQVMIKELRNYNSAVVSSVIPSNTIEQYNPYTIRVSKAGLPTVICANQVINGQKALTVNFSGSMGCALTDLAAPDTTAPTAPTGLTTSSNATADSVPLRWNASTDTGGSGLAGYQIFRCTGTGCTMPATPLATSATATYVDLSVQPTTVYGYMVKAYDAAGNLSAASNTFTVTTPAATPPPDTTSPTVILTTPVTGNTLTGTVNLVANAGDNVAISKVEFLLDNTTLLGTVPGAGNNVPYYISWDSTKASDGPHSITAKAYDTANPANTKTSGAANITIGNTPVTGDAVSPTVSMISPIPNAIIGGWWNYIQAIATDNVRMDRVDFYLNTVQAFNPTTKTGLIGTATSTSSIYLIRWDPSYDPTNLREGNYTIIARAIDGAGNATQASVPIKIDSTPPAVSLTAPSNNTTVTNRVQVKATATDNNKIRSVVFSWTNTNTGDSGPIYVSRSIGANQWSTVWDVTKIPSGVYQLVANANDMAGWGTDSAPVAVTVNNPLIQATVTPDAYKTANDITSVNVTATTSNATVTTTTATSSSFWDCLQYTLDGKKPLGRTCGQTRTFSFATNKLIRGGHVLKVAKVNRITGRVADAQQTTFIVY